MAVQYHYGVANALSGLSGALESMLGGGVWPRGGWETLTPRPQVDRVILPGGDG
jgi:hypothetical protein